MAPNEVAVVEKSVPNQSSQLNKAQVNQHHHAIDYTS